jgi:hypothetical protein
MANHKVPAGPIDLLQLIHRIRLDHLSRHAMEWLIAKSPRNFPIAVASHA